LSFSVRLGARDLSPELIHGAAQTSAIAALALAAPMTAGGEARLEFGREYSDIVGLEGFSNGTVEQTRVLAQRFPGTAFYYTWHEMYPANRPSQVVGST
jgi:hypothetical protein